MNLLLPCVSLISVAVLCISYADAATVVESERELGSGIVLDADAAERNDCDAEHRIELLQMTTQLQPSEATQHLTAESQKSLTDAKLDYTMLALMCTSAAMIAVVAIIFWPKGGFVICRIWVYLFSLTTIKVSVKLVFETGFKFPKLLSSSHMLASSLCGFGVMIYRKMSSDTPIQIPTWSEFIFKIFPLALSFAWSLGANNEALLHVSVAFAEMIAGATPLTSALLVVLTGMSFSVWLLPPTILVVLGVAGTVKGDVSFSLLGLTLCLASNLFRSAKGVLQQMLMTGATKEKYDPCTLLAWQCLAAFVVLLIWSSCTEHAAPYTFLKNQDGRMCLIPIAISCFNACVLNTFAIAVVKDLGAVGSTVAAQTKSAVVILAGVSLLGEEVSLLQIAGYTVVMVGAYWYARVEASLTQSKSLNGTFEARPEQPAQSSSK